MDPSDFDQQTVAVQTPTAGTPGLMAPRVVSGYTLEERLGIGGYGEVWRATGPGGLPKAVKILHGCYDGPQAETELRSLEKVKTLRHPFLLSIERIEVVDGRLIVVTELADGSLQQRFEAVRKAGDRGIARAALQTYLKDAAEALDFLFERHGLQHLDIKPDNLLFQGGHVKIADFGLAKEISRATYSMVNGFTPLYSPPELFEGRPSPSSDQYSLAVVYQEMLTGVPPFEGRTAAQLAVQHLNSKPNLSLLPASDRSTIARALAKNPNARFPNCREFVERLSSRKSRGNQPQRSPVAVPREKEPAVHSDLAPTEEARDTIRVPHSTEIQKATALPRIKGNPSPTSYSPSIVVGVGGLAGQVLCQLRQRMHEAFLDMEEIPSVPVLFVDTDESAIRAARGHDQPVRLRAGETLEIPLRSTNEYRQDRSRHLEWLSRRWLYNIPRSRQVSGIRPLGRLAFVDHVREIRERLKTVIASAIDEKAAQSSQAITGLPFQPKDLTIYLVAATSGGTGSGCALDFSYLLQDVILQMGITKPTIIGMLLHVTSERHGRHQVAVANTLSFLQEMKYYSTPALAYPGDVSCNLTNSSERPFDHAYLLQVSDPSNETQLNQDLQFAAEYLYRNTLTPGQQFFHACRAQEQRKATTNQESFTLRSFRLAESVEHVRQDIEQEALNVCLATVQKWQGVESARNGPPTAPAPSTSNWARALLSQANLQTEQIAALATKIIGDEGRRRIEAYAHTLFKEVTREQVATADLAQRVEQDFAGDESTAPSPHSPRLAVAEVKKAFATLRLKSWQILRDGFVSLVDDAQHGLNGSLEAHRAVTDDLEHTEQQVTALAEQVQRDLERLSAAGKDAVEPGPAVTAPANDDPTTPWVVDLPTCQRLCMLRLCDCVYREIRETVAAIRDQVATLGTTLLEAVEVLGEVSNQLTAISGEEAGANGNNPNNTRPSRAKAFAERFDDHLRSQGRNLLQEMVSAKSSPQVWSQRMRKDVFGFLLEETGATGAGLFSTELGLLGNTASEVTDNTGYRILGVFPEAKCLADLPQRLTEESSSCTTLSQDIQGDLFLCSEHEGLDLISYWTRLATSHPGTADLATRVRCRTDVEWA